MINVSNLRTEVVTPKSGNPYMVALVPSESNPSKFYRVDVVNRRCSCPAWRFNKGHRAVCKHLRALGIDKSMFDLVNPEPCAPATEVKNGVEML